MPKRVVIWGTGFVGKLVLEQLRGHPAFELVGVGVSNPDKVGRDVGDICGLEPVGIDATDDVAALVALEPDALVHFGPTAAHAAENIATMVPFLEAGIDVCSTAMTPWVWPTMSLTPPTWTPSHRGGVSRGWRLVLHDRDRSGVRQRPLPDDAHGALR